MDLSGALQWWEEWQLHVLVLASLGVQCYLAFFASFRKHHIRSLFRFSIWLAYLGGDALAIYALATLFNRQRKLQQKTDSRNLEVLWAPILLIHLGGQLGISAYNIEDNELWKRHIVTAVSQVGVALYVFCKSWSSSADGRLLAVAILLFILGALKCFEKPLALKRATFDSIASTFHPAPRTKAVKRELELEEYIQKAWGYVHGSRYGEPMSEPHHLDPLSENDKVFVDFAYAYHIRLFKLETFWLIDNKTAYTALSNGISEVFNIIYSMRWHFSDANRATERWDYICSLLIWSFNLLLPILTISLFHSSHKDAFRGSDIKVTFILLYITYLAEISSFITAAGFSKEWSDMVAQHSLIGFFGRNKRHPWLMAVAECFKCKGLIDQYFCLEPCYSSREITDLVCSHVRTGWMDYIKDVESYWKFSDSRGHWTLERNGCEEILGGSIDKPFDESIILWHVATDFCFHLKGGASPDSECARQISSYMMHLLFANPEMLMPGSRRSLFTDAYNELDDILEGDDLSSLDEKNLTKKITTRTRSESEHKEGFIHDAWVLAKRLMHLGKEHKMWQVIRGVWIEKKLTKKIIEKAESKEGFIHDAWALAQGLMQLGNRHKMWQVIEGVWIEKLCFCAGRCRGYLHAKSLGSGGEYLTFVSLLMSHAGLETYTERQQRVQLRLPKEVRMHIVRIISMKKEIERAVRERKERTEEAARKEVAGALPQVEVVVSK